MNPKASPTRIGTAGWAIPRATSEAFPSAGSHLERFSRVLNCAEINTSFYRSHKYEVYARWASAVPAEFRFAVKLPRRITHDLRLRASRAPLTEFINQVSGLGDRLAVLLVQLPPSMPFEERPVRTFFRLLAALYAGNVVCEPRHASWFTARVDGLLAKWKVGRVAADPARHGGAERPGGWLGAESDRTGAIAYYRWHGSPRIYYSAYGDEWLAARAAELRASPKSVQCWCIFDNTASGAAAGDALKLARQLR